jgi:hypothetical protein
MMVPSQTHKCARCGLRKGAKLFRRLRDPEPTSPATAVWRDPVCMLCRDEASRGVPVQINTLRARELRLAAQLRTVRAEIRRLTHPRQQTTPGEDTAA